MAGRTVGAYGKLPLSKEFLRHACWEGAARELKGWLDAGHDRLAARATAPARDGNRRRLLFLPASGQEMLAAVAINSRDAGGERRFPFIVFTTLARGDCDRECVATALEPVWAALEQEMERLRAAEDTDAFFRMVREAALEAEPLSRERCEEAVRGRDGVKVEEWLGNLFREDGVDLWVRGLWRLRSVVAPALATRTRSPQLGTFRLPLSRAHALGPQIDLWRAILRALSPALAASGSWVLPGESDPVWALHLFVRAVEPDDFPPVVGETLAAERSTDLCEAGGRLPSDGFGAFRARLDGSILSPTATLAQLTAASLFA